MTAQPNDPWIGVHMLTEFIFCPRAGLMEHERQRDEDQYENMATPSLQYSPAYTEYSIQQRQHQEIQRLWKSLFIIVGMLGLLCFGVVITASSYEWSLFIGVPCIIVAVVIGKRFGSRFLVHFGNLMKYKYDMRKARRALSMEPDAELPNEQPINWWSLQKANFESIPYKDPLRDPKWRLIAKPWRILRKGSLRIPVFRMKHFDPNRKRNFYNQHFARIAAYCYLLETCEGAQSPYGIILHGKTYKGTAIPVTPKRNKIFHDALIRARAHILQASRSKRVPEEPHEDRCYNCPLGKPFVYRPERLEAYESSLPLNSCIGDDGRDYHSACGDRFAWIPPHTKAYEKGLGDYGIADNDY